jgi:hypothetical protein
MLEDAYVEDMKNFVDYDLQLHVEYEICTLPLNICKVLCSFFLLTIVVIDVFSCQHTFNTLTCLPSAPCLPPSSLSTCQVPIGVMRVFSVDVRHY